METIRQKCASLSEAWTSTAHRRASQGTQHG
jgi:hypothetical protein